MRIVIAHNTYLERGGEDTVVEAEHAMLVRYGHDVFRFSMSNDDVQRMSRLSLGFRTVWNREAYARLRNDIRPFRPDVVHFHNTLPLISPAGYAAARAEGAAVVSTLHNYRLICPSGLMYRNTMPCDLCVGRSVAWPGIFYGCYRGSRLATATVAGMVAWHRVTKTYKRLVDRFIALTPFARQQLLRGGLEPDQVVVKQNFLADDPGAGSGAGGYAVFVGRLSPEKGVLDLVHAWKGVRDVPLKIIGDGPLEAAIRDAAAANPNIQVLGRLPREAALRQLRDALVMVFPSRLHENMPMSIIESFACGTPVVAYGHGAAAEMIAHEHTGWLVEPGSSAELERTLQAVLADPAGASSMRARTRMAFLEHYRAADNHEHLMRIYEAAVASRHA
jgi:glycosyltransferase involved in cell wall biosynthesis